MDEKLISKVLKEAAEEKKKHEIDIPSEKRVTNYKNLSNNSVDYNTSSKVYIPTEKEAELYKQLLADFTVGRRNQMNGFQHLAWRNPVDIQEEMFRLFLATIYRAPKDKRQFKEDLVRKIILNKARTYIAQNTNKILMPEIQVKSKTSDFKMLNYALTNAVESVCKETEYEEAQRLLVTATVYSPTAWIRKGYDYNFIHKDGKKCIDHFTSGHNHEVIDANEMMVANPNLVELQEQPFIIRDRYIENRVAKDIYGKHKNYKWIKQGISQSISYDLTNNFWEMEMKEDKNASFYLVKETTFWYRYENRKVVLINNIVVSDGEIEREDGLYPFEIRRYKTLPGQFYGICLAQEFEQEEKYASFLLNVTKRMAVYAIQPPLIVMGKERLDPKVWQPGALIHFKGEQKITPLSTGADLNVALQMLMKTETMGQENISDQLAGQQVGGAMTATQAKLLEGNLNIMAQEWQNVARIFTKKYAMLILGDVLQHDLSVQIDEESGDLIYKDVINKNVPTENGLQDVIVRPVQPKKKLSVKKATDKLKEAGKYSFEPEMEYLLEEYEDALDDNGSIKRDIILFDREEIKGLEMSAEISTTYLSSQDKVLKRAELNEASQILLPMGADPRVLGSKIAELYFGHEAQDIFPNGVQQGVAPQEVNPEGATAQVNQSQLDNALLQNNPNL